MNQSTQWIDQLERLISEKHMICHPMYQAWTQGKLSREILKTYAREYYQHIKAFPTYLSALHSRSDDLTVRKHLLRNLMDEEMSNPDHPALWRAFATSLGVEETDLSEVRPSASTQALIDAFQECCRNEPIAVGLAALYCYESQIPSICQTKIDGLKRWYGMTDPESYRYFTEHETADVEHSQIEKELLLQLVRPEEESAVLQGAKRILDALWAFLDAFTPKCSEMAS